MTRAELAMEITAKLYMAGRLESLALKVLSGVGSDRMLPDRASHPPPGVWHGPPQQVDMLRLELSELKRNMGWSERREFARLYKDWSGR